MIPKVSIGLPVYNGENFIKEAIDSILDQTFRDFELIICDNASTDSTETICKEYQKKDKRITYHKNEKNLGAAYNYNKTFKMARGKYFKWASHDDFCGADFLKDCIDVLDNDPLTVLSYPKTVLVYDDGRPDEKFDDNLNLRSEKPHMRMRQYFIRFLKNKRCNPIFGLIRSDVLGRTSLMGNYPDSDAVLLGELTLLGKFYEIPKHMFFRRLHKDCSVFANPTYKMRAVWFDPLNKNKKYFPSFKRLKEYLNVIRHSPLNRNEKMLCNLYAVGWMLLDSMFFTRIFYRKLRNVVRGI